MVKTTDYKLKSNPKKLVIVPVTQYSSKVAKGLAYRIAGAIRTKKPRMVISILNEYSYLKNEGILKRAVNAMNPGGKKVFEIQDEVYIRACIHRAKYLYGHKADEFISPLEDVLKDLTA